MVSPLNQILTVLLNLQIAIYLKVLIYGKEQDSPKNMHNRAKKPPS